MGSHVFQHVGRGLNRPLTNLVHADRVSAVLANHGNAACGSSSPDVHASSLRSIGGGCRGHWDSDHGLSLLRIPLPRRRTQRRIISLRSVGMPVPHPTFPERARAPHGHRLRPTPPVPKQIPQCPKLDSFPFLKNGTILKTLRLLQKKREIDAQIRCEGFPCHHR